MTTMLEWQFGGGLRALPVAAAWSILAVVALIGLWLVVRSYRRTAGNLSPGSRCLLVVLRGSMLLLLLLCLANPTRVDRSRPESSRRELAVLVDRSASMDQPDHRGATRLAEAVRVWKQHETEAAQVFSDTEYFVFGKYMEPAASFAAAVKSYPPGEETHLYSALTATLKKDPAAIVCLTDGLDTSSDKMSAAISAATERNVPLYFVVGNNRARPAGQSMSIREVKIPSRVLRQSRFTATALVEIFSTAAREVSLELWSGDTKLAATNQPVRAGTDLISWPVEVAAGEPAVMPLEFRLGSGAQQQIAGHTTRVVANTTVNLLYYQGALQWGYRFLRGALESDPSFHVTAILNPALGVQLSAGIEGQSTMTDLPEDARELKRFQIVVLANAFADLLTPKQQRALLEYARGGGGVLFISPNNEATRRFSGTPLEQLLPVVFEPPGAAGSDPAGARFQEQMRALGGGASADGVIYLNSAMPSQTVPELVPFKATTGASAARLFRATAEMPRFSTYARVRAVKPGAEILAVHPTERSPADNSPRVLVARQQFGEGFTAAMNTDLLWRWKLSLASTNHSPEIFWQQFFLSLAQPVQTPGVEITRRTESPQLNRPVTLRVTGSAESMPTLALRSPLGKTQRLTLAPVETEGVGTWEASFIPDAEGCWEAKADAAEGDAATASIAVVTQTRTAEMMNLPPDVDGLRQLAAATGGALIEPDHPAFSQFAHERPGEILRTRLLWNNGWIVALLLGAYVVELIVRRMFRLL